MGNRGRVNAKETRTGRLAGLYSVTIVVLWLIPTISSLRNLLSKPTAVVLESGPKSLLLTAYHNACSGSPPPVH